jgi:spore maturation protein CgeB
MVQAGYSPSVRLFEAAGCGSAIISDDWNGLDSFFVPQEEILLARSSAEVVNYLADISPAEAHRIGSRAQERVLAEHSAARRALQFEEAIAARTVGQVA